ncbi:MAG: hypothetical protein Q9227_007610 [Pyrenula ochraceoflavens]
MSITKPILRSPVAEPEVQPQLPVQSEVGKAEVHNEGDREATAVHLETVVAGLGQTDVLEHTEEAAIEQSFTNNKDDETAEPEIIPLRPRSPPRSTSGIAIPQARSAKLGLEAEIMRGRIPAPLPDPFIATKLSKRRQKRTKRPAPSESPAISAISSPSLQDFVADDSDSSAPTSRVMSPVPRLPPLAGASPQMRPASPGISNLKLQLDALGLGSQPGSRSASKTRSKLGSPTTSSASSAASDLGTEDDSSTEMCIYEVPLDQDYVNDEMETAEASSLSTACPDQLTSSKICRKMTASDFTALKTLGKGTYGTVILVKQNATGRLFAQKQFRKASLTVHKKLVEQTKTERSILESVNRHPFIVNLYYAFQDQEQLYLILEYASGGELFHHLELEKFFTEEVAAFYMASMILALEHLHHEVGVIYRDLKPENCLLDAEGHLLLTDFGLSKVAVDAPGTPNSSRANSTAIGTLEYMAPEVIKGSELSAYGPGYTKACDWWSLGALGVDLMTGSPPFGGNNYTKKQQNIMKQKLSLPFYLSPDAKDLLTRLLRKEPNKRLGAKGPPDIAIMKKHRFFRKIDWAKLKRRELEPPIRPLITDPELAENFDPSFTGMAMSARRTEEDGLAAPNSADPFGGFSFVASTSLLEDGWLEREMRDGEEDY